MLTRPTTRFTDAIAGQTDREEIRDIPALAVAIHDRCLRIAPHPRASLVVRAGSSRACGGTPHVPRAHGRPAPRASRHELDAREPVGPPPVVGQARRRQPPLAVFDSSSRRTMSFEDAPQRSTTMQHRALRENDPRRTISGPALTRSGRFEPRPRQTAPTSSDRWLPLAVCAIVSLGASRLTSAGAQGQAAPVIEYKVLATGKTSTMEKELNEAAEAGFRFQSVMGGDTAFGGNEVVVVMSRSGSTRARYAYKLLATSRTSTMQKEVQEAADRGFHYRGQTVFETLLGGDEVVVSLERDEDTGQLRFEYKLFATSKTGTLQKELLEAGAAGFELLGMTVSNTALGGKELVAITRRARPQ
jgi:hypothetical protein